MTREKARQHLESGGSVYCPNIIVTKYYMQCSVDGPLSGLEDALQTLIIFCDGNWDEVDLL